MLFQLESSGATPKEVVELFRTCFGEGPLPDEFSVDLFRKVADSLDAIDEAIVGASENWRLERMSRVDRNIMRIGVYELSGDDDTPPRVAINEAVELAKRFGTADSASFVNGILDRVAHDEKRL